MMTKPYTVYGAPGSGSVPVEATLTLIGAPYDLVGHDVMRPVACNPAANAVNPLHQVPVLTLPTGEIMTESAAILIYLADSYPHARLAPAVGDPRRPGLPAVDDLCLDRNLWPCLRSAHDPMRLVAIAPGPHHPDWIAIRRADCWRHVDSQITTGPASAGR